MQDSHRTRSATSDAATGADACGRVFKQASGIIAAAGFFHSKRQAAELNFV